MELLIDVLNDKEKSIVNLSGEIDVYTAPKLKGAISPLATRNGHLIEVDFEHVNYMDSTGLGVFIGILKATKEHNSHLKLINLQTGIYRLFKITGLDEIMDIHSLVRGGR